MKEYVGTKSILGIITTVFAYLSGCFNELIVFLAMFIISDYVLGILVAFRKKKQFDKDLALWGAVKKVLYGVLLVIAFSCDYIIVYLAKDFGVVLPVKGVFGIATTIYLLGTEGFSNARNLMILGLPVPKVLLSFFGLIKDQAGKIASIPANNEAKKV
jgi:phage-related holin